LLRTSDGKAWVTQRGRTWRMLSWVDGDAVAKVPNQEWAEQGGALVGRFHRVMESFAYDYKFTRAGVHDTVAHLQKLTTALASFDGRDLPATQQSICETAKRLAREILAMADLQFDIDAMPQQHIHGDLKISNLLFQTAPQLHGRCLVDLDTVGKGTLAFELGDAMRSWCNPHGEDSGSVTFEIGIFSAAMRGYFSEAPNVGMPERLSIVHGLQRVCVELAARFCADVFADSYFGWDRTRFDSRRSHNLIRAEGQLALARSVATQFADAVAALSTL
jgi:Ser/Thr protein kinase RdoA (MazF antagonist)